MYDLSFNKDILEKMVKAKHQSSWEKHCMWEKHSKFMDHAFCNHCSSYVNISESVIQLQVHKKVKTLMMLNLEGSNQSLLQIQWVTVSRSPGKQVLSSEDQIIHSEMIRCLDIILANSSFSAVKGDNKKYK